MGPWNLINMGTIPVNSLVLYYVPEGTFVWGTGNDRESIQKEYPTVTHYRIVSESP